LNEGHYFGLSTRAVLGLTMSINRGTEQIQQAIDEATVI
jgi:hypothetical protein